MRWIFSSCLALALVPACGPGPSPFDAGHFPDAPRDTADAIFVGESVTFHVVRGGSLETASPASECPVSIVAPGPRRLESTTDAEGVVTLSGLTWDDGERISATFFCPGYSAYSISGFSREGYDAGLVDGRFEIFLLAHDPPPEATIHVMGTAGGFSADPMAVLYAQPTLFGGTTSAARGAAFAFQVPPATPFDLLLTDLLISRGIDRSLVQTIAHWSLTEDVGPLSADATIAPDLVADALTPATSTASFVLPDAPFFRDVGSELNVLRTSFDGQVVTGFATSLTVGADERTVDFTFERVDLPGATESRTIVTISGPMGSASSVLPIDFPSGAIDPRFVTPPTIEDVASRALFAPVPVGGAVPELETRVRITTTDDTLLWTIAAPLGASNVVIPALPFETDEAALGPSGTPVYLDVTLCELVAPDARTERCLRTATSDHVLAAVP